MHRTLLAAAAALGLAPALAAQIAGFPTYAGILADLNTAAANHPAICQVVDLTARYAMPLTRAGNRLYAIKVSDNVAVDEDEPRFLLVAAHHGNEYGTPIVALDALARLTQGYGVDPAITAIVDEYEIWIAPCWNPDGYPTSRTNAIGVDLNRNYPFLWNTSCNTGAAGASPGSEPETMTMMAWSEDRRFTKVLDFHSSGREVLFAYRPDCGQHALGAWLQAEATSLSQASSYGGAVRGPTSNGEHYQWQLGNFANYAFLTEIDITQSPSRAGADAEAVRLWPGTLWMLQRPVPVQGHVTDSVTGLPLEAGIRYLETPFSQGERNRSEPAYGRYHAFLPPGNHTLRFEAAGYAAQEIPVTVVAGSSVQLDVQLSPPNLTFAFPNGLPAAIDPGGGTAVRVDVVPLLGQPRPGSGRLHVESANGAQTLAMSEIAPHMYRAELPGFACGDSVRFWFSAADTNGQVWTSASNTVPTAFQVVLVGSDTFEVPSGWVGGQPGDTATTGIWGRADPVATAAQPGDDHTPAGTQCWVTDGRGGALGSYDVDNGFTTLLSPAFDLTATPDAAFRYWRWFSNNQGSATDDVFRVDVSDNNGGSWVNAETVGVQSPEAGGGWFQHGFRVADFVAPTAQVRIRFVAEDVGVGSIVEAAVDDFEIVRVLCDGAVARGGAGCPDGSGTTLRLEQSGSMHLGGTFALGVVSGTMLPSFLFAGLGDSSWNGAPLPQVIPGTGVPGCKISVQPEVSLGLVPYGGAFQQTVPSLPVLIGTRIFWQAGMIDPGLTTPVTIATTDHLATTLGS